LGPTALANSFLSSLDEFAREASYPLDVYFCRSCSLVQLLDVIDPEVLFRNYIYVSGTSDTMAAHYEEYAAAVIGMLRLTADDLVAEVASNDGSLLRRFAQRGIRVLGVEPASNIARIAAETGVPTVNAFFNFRAAQSIQRKHGFAKAVLANNVLAHVDETRDFLLGCRRLLAPGGLAVIEVPYLGDLLDRLEYDTIYHEHLCYFSVTALMRLCEEAGLAVVRIDRVPVHGGSLRVYASADRKEHSPAVRALASGEERLGFTGIERFQELARAVEANRRALVSLLERLHGEGRSLAGYGAPAKGNTLLNYCGIGPRLVPFTVDKNPLKVGKFTPGMHIPVLPVSELLARRPDYTLILAWNFASEILEQQSEYRARGGRFIVPVPEPRIL
jgi:SAM-dependent methyltransferase